MPQAEGSPQEDEQLPRKPDDDERFGHGCTQPFSFRIRQGIRTMPALHNHTRAGQAPPQLEEAISLDPRSTNKKPRKEYLHFKLERRERCTSPIALNPLRQAEPKVGAELTRPQNTTKNCLLSTCRAKIANTQRYRRTRLHPKNKKGTETNQSEASLSRARLSAIHRKRDKHS